MGRHGREASDGLARNAGTVVPVRFLAGFGVLAVAEMATFFWVESRVGLASALALALATALIGSVLVRREGLSVLGRISRRMRQGQLPGRELTDGAAILVAGAFLISPGFITDTLGFLLLIPPVRDVIYRVVSRRLSARMTVAGHPLQDRNHGRDVIDIDPDDVD
jgi:UPF0716 protein FxsA